MRKLLMESNLDFLCITESWLNCNVSTDRVNIPGYSCYRKDRTTDKVGYGGVLIYIRESFKCAQLSLDDLECLGINVILSHNMNFNIVVLYNPPGHDINLYNELKGLLSACDHFNETIFLGDYNVNWADKKAKTKLKAAMEKFKYKQLIDKATRITRKTETLIDLIFTNRPERVIKTYNLITGLSDHNMTLVVRKLSHKRLVHHDRTENKSSTTGIPRRNITNFDHDLMGVNWESITAELDLDASVNNFTSTMSNLINKHTKTWKSRPKKYSLPWFNQDILQLSKKRDLARKKSLMTKTITDHLLLTALRNKVVSELRKARSNYFRKLIEEANGNSSKLWQHINRVTDSSKHNHSKIINLKVNNNIIDNNVAMANIFNTFFIESVEELSRKFKSSKLSSEQHNIACSDNFQIKEVSSNTVAKYISNMNNSMSKDIHGLSAELIKRNQNVLLEPITHLVNLSIKTNKFPESWKMAIIAPIHKSGDKDTASNYRPIAILPVVSKILEKVVAAQLTEYLESNHLLHPQQFGFRPKYSTEIANCYLLNRIKDQLVKGHVVGTVFLDLKKAFDTVNHRVLLSKLLRYFQMSAEALQWFESYLGGRQQCVKVNGEKSSFIPNSMGVPQGSVLGPLLFSMYINDLPKICPGVGCQMYADDTVIYVSAKTASMAAVQLTQELENISNWLESSQLTLNVKKTVSMCISIRNRPGTDPFKVKIKNETISELSEVKYLGIILDKNLKFGKQVKHICKKVKPNLNCFRHIRRDLTFKTAQLYMHAMIFCLTVLLHYIMVTGISNCPETNNINLQTSHKNYGSETNGMAPLWHHKKA